MTTKFLLTSTVRPNAIVRFPKESTKNSYVSTKLYKIRINRQMSTVSKKFQHSSIKISTSHFIRLIELHCLLMMPRRFQSLAVSLRLPNRLLSPTGNRWLRYSNLSSILYRYINSHRIRLIYSLTFAAQESRADGE